MNALRPGTPLESRRSAYKRELLWASVFFLLMFLTVLGLGSAIIINDLSNKEVFKIIDGYSAELERLMAHIPTSQNLKGFKQETVITTQLNAFLTQKQIFDSVEVYDDKGKLVRSQSWPKGGEVGMGGPPTGLLPGQRRVETKDRIPITVPFPLEPGKVGQAILSVSKDVLTNKTKQFQHELEIKLVGMTLVILFMVGGAYVYVLRVLKLTRRLEAEAQAQQRLSYLGLLSSGIAHEVKNPLNSIQMNLQLLEEEASSGATAERLHTWIEPIQREIKRLERLVNDFLLYARPLSASPVALDVSALLQSIANLVAEEARQRGASVRLDVAEGLTPLVTDENLLRTALMNLVFNALQAMEGGGTVVLRADQGDGTIRLDVDNDGPSIPPESRESIFDIFYTTKSGGTGLGLPISRRILETLGGTLELVDRHGPGACFRATLPEMEAA